MVGGGLLACLAVALVRGCGRSGEELLLTRVTVDSTPEQGAEVLIDGVERGLTPVTIEGLRSGWVDVLLKRERYKNTADRIEIKPGVEATYLLEMEPLVGYLTLESTPTCAQATLDDGEVLGQTPIFSKRLPIGKYTYTIEKENHYPVTKSLDVEEDFQYEFKHKLEPKEATLSVISRPSGAEIFINTQPQAAKTPANFELQPGLYLISVHAKGFVQKEMNLSLGPNENRSVTFELEQGKVPVGMVLVPAGEFLWGENGRAPDERPQRKVALDAYYIDKYEVTNAEFKRVFPNHVYPKGQDEFPASGISWSKAVEYAQAVGKRLPTEAEWEKAARGLDGREYPWGNKFEQDFCNTRERELEGPLRAGSFIGGRAPYGCMDMAGSVYEWTQDWYDAYPGNSVITTDYGQVFRVLRGGSYAAPKFNARCARRHFDRMDSTRADYGFRCAKEVDDPSK